MLKPALTLAGDFWERADAIVTGKIDTVEERMRDLLHAVKEYAAELPESDAAKQVVADSPHGLGHRGELSARATCCSTASRPCDADPDVDEIVLVNNGNPMEMLERVEERVSASRGKVKVIGGGENRGFAAGVNLGAAAQPATGCW